jgi:hypothetical protein
MGVPNVFGSATTSIPLSQLDANFNTGLTIGNTTIGLGNTTTTLGNVTLSNVSIVSSPNANVTIGNTTIGIGNTATSLGNVTLANSTINFATSLSLGNSTVNTALGQGNASAMKNRIINGAMVIDQRNAGASVSATNSFPYTLDRWQAVASQNSKYTVQQNAGSVTLPIGFSNYLGVTSSSAYTVGSAEQFRIIQSIEGYNIADLGWGTADAKTVTLSFWVRSSLTGTFGGSLANDGYARSYPFTYTISSANTWEQKSITITGDTSGTWLKTNGAGIVLSIGLGVGSSLSGTAGSWAGATYVSATGATSVVGTNGATFYITGVQLEVGSSATGFEYRQYTTELQLCQRYFEKSYAVTTAPATATYAGNEFQTTWGAAASRPFWSIRFATAKRSTSVMTFYSPQTGTAGKCYSGGSGTDLNCTYNDSATSNFGCYQSSGNSSATAGSDYYLQWTASSEI